MAGGYDTDDTAGLPDPATLPDGEAADAAWIEVIRKMDEVYADLVRYQVELEHKHAELEEAHGFISGVLAAMSDALIVCDAEGRIERVNPALERLTGRHEAGLHAQPEVGADERQLVERLLAPTGRLLWLEREEQLDAVTAVSGSGPAYVFYVLEAMIEAGASLGLTAAQARQLAQATFDGAAALAAASPESPETLRAQVTSKGGTTHAAVSVLEAQGVKAAFVQALRAAAARADELGREAGP